MRIIFESSLLPFIELGAEKKSNFSLLETNFKILEEGRHQGITGKFINKEKAELITAKSIHYRTTLNDNEFIYEEITTYKDFPLLLLAIFNIASNNVLELLIFFEEDQIVQQIRKLNIDKYKEQYENNESPIKLETNKNTFINKLTLLTFIIDYDLNIKEEVQLIRKLADKEITKKLSVFEKTKLKIKKWWKEKSSWSKKWFFCKIFALIGCIIVSTGLGLIPTTIILGINAIKPIAITVSILLGFVAIPWNNVRNKIVDWVFGKKEKKFEDWEEFKLLKKENEKIKNNMQKLWTITLDKTTKTEKKDIILDKFHQFLDKNKDTSADDLEKWLSNKIDEQHHFWEQAQVQKIELANEKWNQFKTALHHLDPWELVDELQKRSKYNHKGKRKNTTNFKQYSQEMYNNFQKDAINNKWNFKAKINDENKKTSIITNNPFKSLDKNKNLNSLQPLTNENQKYSLKM